MKIPAAILVAALAIPHALAAEEVALPAAPPVQGEVLDVLDAGAFTYVRLRTANGETWAGVRRATLTKGDQVTIGDPVMMQDFESKALQRRFDVIVFGTLTGAAGAASRASMASPGASPAAAPPAERNLAQFHGSPARPSEASEAKVPKAEGAEARTVAEVHADRLALKDQAVTIRARAVKVTPGVMGRNWIHLRDGSGSASDGSDDIVVTSQDEPKVGEVVVAKGVVRTDVNLGSGYAYKVLVEDVSFWR